jgi:hypothetical protein
MGDLVHYSISILAGLAAAFLTVLATGVFWTTDEASRITSISVSNSIAYLPYLFAVYWASRVHESRQLRQMALIGAILFRLFGLACPPVLSDDHLRYEWEARMLTEGKNPYRISPAQNHEPNLQIPGYDFSAVYGPVIEAANWAAYCAGLPLKAPAALAEGLLLWLCWRARWPLWKWMLLGWSPLNVYEYWINGHSDSILTLLLTAAFLAQSWKSWTLLALATLTKWWPVLLVPFWMRWNWTGLGFGAYGILLSSCLFLMPLGEWIQKVRFTTGFLGGWQNNAFLYRLLTDKMQAIGILVVSSIGLPFWRWGRAEGLVSFITILLSFSANIHPWYLGWILPFLAASRFNPLPWLLAMALLPLAYDPMVGWRLNGTWQEDLWIRNLIWGSVLAFGSLVIIRKTGMDRIN